MRESGRNICDKCNKDRSTIAYSLSLAFSLVSLYANAGHNVFARFKASWMLRAYRRATLSSPRSGINRCSARRRKIGVKLQLLIAVNKLHRRSPVRPLMRTRHLPLIRRVRRLFPLCTLQDYYPHGNFQAKCQK